MTRRKKKPAPQPRTARDTSILLRKETVENPDWEPSKDGEAGFDRYETREKNVKESAVEWLYARKALGFSQKRAADRFRELVECVGGKTSSIDYTMDRVDGGKGDPAIARLYAARELKRCRLMLGRRGFDVVHAVCAEGKALTDISRDKRDRITLADNLRADLDELASMWGMQTRRRPISSGERIVSEKQRS